MLPVINLKRKFRYTVHHTGETIVASSYDSGQQSVLQEAFEFNTLSDSSKHSAWDKIQFAIRTLCNECILSENVDVTNWPDYEIEYFMIQLRIHSTGDITNRLFTCNNIIHSDGISKECGTSITLPIDFKDFKIIESDAKVQTEFEITPEYTLHLSYIETLNISKDRLNSSPLELALYKLVYKDIELGKVTEYYFKDESEDSIKSFVSSLSPSIVTEILEKFFNRMPKVEQNTSIICPSCGHIHSFKSVTLRQAFI